MENENEIKHEIKHEISVMTQEERAVRLDEIYKKWTRKEQNITDVIKNALGNYGLDQDSLRMGNFENAKKVALFEISYLNLFFTKLTYKADEQSSVQELDRNSENQDSVEETLMNYDLFKRDTTNKFNKIYSSMLDAENSIKSLLFLQTSMASENYICDDGSSFNLNRFIPQSEVTKLKPLSPYQDLLMYVSKELSNSGYMRFEGECYGPIYTKGGHNTHCWKKMMSLVEFIHTVANSQNNFTMWKNLTHQKNNITGAVEYLSTFQGTEFEDIKKDRNTFSFRNGIYFTKKKNKETGFVEDHFIPYDSTEPISSSIVACNYFDTDFEYRGDLDPADGDWFSIIEEKCPNLNGIMDYQGWDRDVKKWLCILIGRNLYDLGELDEWQVIAYLLGQAGSGKSTILTKVVKLIFANSDVGVVSNNIETKFGLATISRQLMYIGPEIKENWSLDQAEFQAMVSGEEMQIAEKNKNSFTVKWGVPGILAGNLFPDFCNNSDSVSRRIIAFHFDRKVDSETGDTQLGKKLQYELPNIIQACTKGYLQTIRNSGSSDIWKIVPEYFVKNRDAIAENTNALVNFMKSEKICIRKGLYVRETVFKQAFFDHCNESNLKKPKWNKEYYSRIFANFKDITTKRYGTHRNYPIGSNSTFKGNFIDGLDIVTESDQAGGDFVDSAGGDEYDDDPLGGGTITN